MNGGRTLLPNLEVAGRQAVVAHLEDRLEDLVDTELLDTGLRVVEAVGLLLILVRTTGMAVDHQFHLLPLLLLEEGSSMLFGSHDDDDEAVCSK